MYTSPKVGAWQMTFVFDGGDGEIGGIESEGADNSRGGGVGGRDCYQKEASPSPPTLDWVWAWLLLNFLI